MAEILGLGSDDFYEEVIQHFMDDRTLILNGEIGSALLEDCAARIIMWNMEDKDLPGDKRHPIKLVIHSEGGEVYAGRMLADVIKASETPVYAVGMGLVASMAFHIYIVCNERYAFPNTTFLMHDGYISMSSSASKMKDTMEYLNKMDDIDKQDVLTHTKMTSEFYDSKFSTEFYMLASTDGVEYGILDKIIGKDVALSDVF